MKRDSRPLFLGAAVNKFLSSLGAKTSDSDLAAKWGELFGNDSSLVKISRGVKDRTATLKAANPAARLTLQFESPEIIKKINAYFGYDAVSKITVR